MLAVAAAFAAACIMALPACNNSGHGNGGDYSSLARYYNKFDTVATLVVTADFTNSENTEKLSNLGAAVENFLTGLENSLSTTVATSCISRFNAAAAGEEVPLDELTYTVLSEAVAMYEYTDGYYNPAVYYSVDLFGFSPRFNDLTWSASLPAQPYDRLSEDGTYVTALAEPDERYVELFKDLASHMSELEIYERDGAYYALKPDYTVTGPNGDSYTLALDLGGIGKGYAADVVTSMMEEYGFEYGFFDFGSSSVSARQSYEGEDGKWELNLVNPDSSLSGTYARVYVSSASLSTSGDYEKCYTLGDATYCHIIDPFTGRPKSIGIAACTVIGGTAARDDALTTALSVMGEEKAVQFINDNLKDYQVVMIVRGDDGPCDHVVTNVENLEYNPAYTLGNTIDGQGNIVLN